MRKIVSPDRELSELERQVMSALWDRGRSTARDLREILEPEKPLALTTILTILARLRKKGYIIEVPRLGRSMVFAPLVPRKSVAQKCIRGLLKQFFSGSPSSLVAHLLESEKISDEELAEIRKRLEEKMKLTKRRS